MTAVIDNPATTTPDKATQPTAPEFKVITTVTTKVRGDLLPARSRLEILDICDGGMRLLYVLSRCGENYSVYWGHYDGFGVLHAIDISSIEPITDGQSAEIVGWSFRFKGSKYLAYNYFRPGTGRDSHLISRRGHSRTLLIPSDKKYDFTSPEGDRLHVGDT